MPLWDLTVLRTQKHRVDWSRTAVTCVGQKEMSLTTTTAGLVTVLPLAILQNHVLSLTHCSPVHSVIGCLLLT